MILKKRFDSWNYEVDWPLQKEVNKEVIRITEDELGGKNITKFVELKLKTYSYLEDDGNGDKKTKGTEKCVIKQELKFEDYKNCLKILKY